MDIWALKAGHPGADTTHMRKRFICWILGKVTITDRQLLELIGADPNLAELADRHR